jgi:hypothetical protein
MEANTNTVQLLVITFLDMIRGRFPECDSHIDIPPSQTHGSYENNKI